MKTRSWILCTATAVTGFVAAQAQVRTIGFNFGSGSGTTSATSGIQDKFSVGSFAAENTSGTLGTNPNSTSPVSTGYAGASGGFKYDNVGSSGAEYNGSGRFSITITPNTGFRVTLNDFDFGARSISGTDGPVGYTLRTSINNFATPLASGTFTADGSWAYKDNTFSPLTGALNTPVILQLYVWGNTTVTSSVANISIDDVALSVTVPEASDCALYGCAAMVGFTWWRRSKKSVKQA